MNINTYLQDYLDSNNTKVIAYISTFIELGIANINKVLRAAFLEVTANTATLPTDFVAMRALNVNNIPYTYATTGEDGTYNIVANALVVYPTPSVDDILTYTCYVINQSVLTSYSPNLLLHAAAIEAYMYIGDMETVAIEKNIYDALLEDAKGWDTQGTISLGGVTG